MSASPAPLRSPSSSRKEIFGAMSQEDIYDESMLEANQAFTNAILG